MDVITIAGFRAHASSSSFQRRHAESARLLKAMLGDKSYVSFSAGKDSSVVAHMCHRVRPGIHVLMVDPGCPVHWLDGERRQWLEYAAGAGWNLTLFPWDKAAATADAATEEDHRRLAHKNMFSDLHAYAASHGLTQRITGMRADESRSRRITTATRGMHYALADGGSAVNPIATWSVDDVWAYIVATGMPWLSIYDHLGPSARNGLIGRSGASNGRMAWLKMHYPDAWMVAKEMVGADADQYS